MEVCIRKAERSDCEAMFKLIKELASYEKALEQVTLSVEEFTEDGFGSNPIWGAFVAEYQSEILGISLFYDRFSTWRGRRLYLEDLVVTEKWRGKQIGRKLFDATVDFGKQNGYNGMVFQVLNWNQPAIEFYKKYNTQFDNDWSNVSIDF